MICANFGAMAEAARAAGGGCLMVDVRKVDEFAKAMASVADDPDLFDRLTREAVSCPIKSWETYSDEVVAGLTNAT